MCTFPQTTVLSPKLLRSDRYGLQLLSKCEVRPGSNLNTWQANKEDPYEFEASLGWQSETLFKTKQKTNVFLTRILCTRIDSHGGILSPVFHSQPPPPLSTGGIPIVPRSGYPVLVSGSHSTKKHQACSPHKFRCLRPPLSAHQRDNTRPKQQVQPTQSSQNERQTRFQPKQCGGLGSFRDLWT